MSAVTHWAGITAGILGCILVIWFAISLAALALYLAARVLTGWYCRLRDRLDRRWQGPAAPPFPDDGEMRAFLVIWHGLKQVADEPARDGRKRP